MSKSFESVGDHWRRIRAGKRLPPLRTLKEMAEEFGLPTKTLASWVHHYGGPKPKLRNPGYLSTACWYDPREMRAWWATVQKK